MKEVLDAVLGWGAFEHTADAFVGTDNFDFLLEGIPNLVANQDSMEYLPNYHAESDTYDKADLRELKFNAAIAAVLTYGAAERPGVFAKRQTRQEVEKTIQETGLDAQMKAFGLWDGWVTKKRGRSE